MNHNYSKYGLQPSKDLKLTYWLGAGASYNSIPILNLQSSTMRSIGQLILEVISSGKLSAHKPHEEKIMNNDYLKKLSERIIHFASKAEKFGSIDTYARRLWLLNRNEELHELRECVSIYFYLWSACVKERMIMGAPFNSVSQYNQIDKRYISLMSILLNKTDSLPSLNKDVNFITWNYDLQLEKSYHSFLPEDSLNLDSINNTFPFKQGNEKENDVVHLNGHYGYFEYENKEYTLAPEEDKTFIECLSTLVENSFDFPKLKGKKQFQKFDSSIRYAWEMDSEKLNNVLNIMSETEVLVIIGYSFPAFNREIDTKLIRAFEKKQGYKRVVYQDPNANDDIVSTLFTNTDIIKILNDKEPSQFYVPHEYLYYEESELTNIYV